MPLSGPQLHKIHQAFLRAFDPPTLEGFMPYTMDKRLFDVAMGSDFEEIVRKLLTRANMQGWLPDLVQKAAAEFPLNDDLQSVAKEFGFAVPPSPVMPFTKVEGANLQRVVDKNSTLTDIDSFMDRLKRVSHGVCHVKIPGVGGGTGFLVGPNLVITNSHVVGGLTSLPDGGTCIFGHRRDVVTGVIDAGRSIDVDPAWEIITRPYSASDVGMSTQAPANDELDYAILRLSETAANKPLDRVSANEFGWFQLADAINLPGEGSPVFILQHPQPEGSQGQMPLQLSIGITIGSPWPAKRLRYNSTTHPGSSGSPCFDRELRLTALHHAGDPNTLLNNFNQGIPVRNIVADLNARASEFKAQDVGPFWV